MAAIITSLETSMAGVVTDTTAVFAALLLVGVAIYGIKKFKQVSNIRG